ncbi:MAG: hypothetical protein ABR526_00330 [Chthoniobacterales bacterium]
MNRSFILAALVVAAVAATARAQEQEGKLMTRLLKPDMSLQNGAESKKFVVRGSTATSRVPTKTFQFISRIFARNFTGTRAVKPQEFHTNTSRFQRAEANLHTRNAPTENGVSYRTSAYSGVTAAPDAAKAISTAAYSEDQRAFLVRGKSQKSLSAQDRPLTIEEVRELLNKNK